MNLGEGTEWEAEFMMSCRTSKENWNLFGPEVQGSEVTWLPLSLCVAETRGEPISPDSLDGQRRQRLAAGWLVAVVMMVRQVGTDQAESRRCGGSEGRWTGIQKWFQWGPEGGGAGSAGSQLR